MSEFALEDLKDILEGCTAYQEAHHLGRPFMSAYQIAIEFARRYPEHPAVVGLPIGGQGVGVHQSLAQRIARFLSGAIRDGDGELDGGFLSHDHLHEMLFRDAEGGDVRVSLHSASAHAIFRMR